MKLLKSFLGVLLLTPMLAIAADKFPDISEPELKQAIAEKKVTLLDANGSDSYKEGHIPGALDFTATKADLAAHLPKDKSALIVAYCGNENCPLYKNAAEKAKDLGYTNVKHFAKGIQGWKKSGEKVETNS